MYKYRILIRSLGSWILYHTQEGISESSRIAYSRSLEYLSAWTRGTFRVQVFELGSCCVLVDKKIVKL